MHTQSEHPVPEEAPALSGSLEDYLEAIYHLAAAQGSARAKDIAEGLKVRRASVTGALRALAARGLVNYEPYAAATLTEAGRAAAEDIIRRHEALRDFFIRLLGIDAPEADAAACRMEHNMPRHILDRFIDFVEFAEVCPRTGNAWALQKPESCHHGASPGECTACVDALQREVCMAAQHAGEGPTACLLTDLAPSQRGRILSMSCGSRMQIQMGECGGIPGAIVTREFGHEGSETIAIKIKGHRLVLTKREAQAITVERLG